MTGGNGFSVVLPFQPNLAVIPGRLEELGPTRWATRSGKTYKLD